MKRILVAYATMAGSTAEVAQAVAEEIARPDVQVDVLPLNQVEDLAAYDGVVLGAPMIMGWHRSALGFLRSNRATFQRIPLAVFVTCMSLTETGETSVDGVPVDVDEKLPKPPETPGRLRFRERYAQLAHYVRPILKASDPAKPVSIGVFGGRLDYGRLKVWAVLFAMLIIRAPAGDRRNWTAIRAWAASLAAVMGIETLVTDGEGEDQVMLARGSG
jgi:menaquinone-dependent protoporphyrinogen oxidase